MATERLQVILQMAAGQYKREAREAATATGGIAQSAKNASTETGNLGKRFGGVATAAKVFLAGAATAAVVSFAKSSIQASSNLQESMNAVNVVFGESADGIHAIGEEAASSFGLSQRSFNEFATRFSAFAQQIATRDGRDVVEVVEEMTGRIADFASVHNLSLERAAEVAQSTLAGETEVFRRFGGDVSAAAVQSKLLEDGIIGVGEAASEQDKILGRYLLFMEQTAATAGDFKNTQDDAANALRTAQAEFEDASAELGDELLPIMVQLVETGRDLIPVLETVAKVLGAFFAPTDLERWAIQTGQAAGSAELLAGAISLVADNFADANIFASDGTEVIFDFRQQLEELVTSSGASDKELRKLRDGLDNLVESGRLSAGEAAILAEILAGELAPSAAEVEANMAGLDGELEAIRRGSKDAAPAVDDLADSVAGQTGLWGDLVTSMEDYQTMLARLTDPVFRHIDDQRSLQQAQEDYSTAVEEFGDKSPEAIEAGFELAEAQLAVNSSAQDLPGVVDEGTDSIIILGREAGITEDTLRSMRDVFDSFDGRLSQAEINVRVNQTGAPFNVNEFEVRHSGGHGRAGTPYRIRPEEEIFVPSGNGQFLLNSEVISALKGLSGGVTDNRQFNFPMVSSGDRLVDAQLQGARYSIIRRMETI